MQKDKKTSLIELFQSNGLLLPNNEDEVLAFENSNDTNNETPKDFDNPMMILDRGKIKKHEISNLNPKDEVISNLAIAARDGKAISTEIRNKMNNDRKNSKKK